MQLLYCIYAFKDKYLHKISNFQLFQVRLNLDQDGGLIFNKAVKNDILYSYLEYYGQMGKVFLYTYDRF